MLKELTRLAESDELHGLVFVGKFGGADHRAGSCGDYRRWPAEALTATFIMERFLEAKLPCMLYGEAGG